jgi:hypothetical protein
MRPGTHRTKTGRPFNTLWLLPTLLSAALALSGGCSSGGGSGGGGSSSAGSSGAAASAASEAHWQTALAALGTPYSPGPVAFDQAALDDWNFFFRRGWPGDRFFIEQVLERELGAQVAAIANQVTLVRGVRSLSIELDDAPRLGTTAPDELVVSAPGAPATWRMEMELEVGATVQTQVLGVPISTTVLLDVRAEVEDIRITLPVRFDLSDPRRPAPQGSGAPQVNLRIVLSSQSPLLSTVAPALTRVLDPVVRAALVIAAAPIQQQITGAAGQLALPPFGLGGPGIAPVAQPQDLATLSDSISDEIQAHHLPFGTLLGVEFDQPGHGNGVPVGYRTYGDSTIWTGHYLRAEALRYDLTGDARALAGAERALKGFEGCLDVSSVDGRLSRCIVPASSPHISAINGGLDFAWGTVDGALHGSEGDISRDQYLGAYMGFTSVYRRIPALRDRARDGVSRMLRYIDGHDWFARRTDGVTPARARYAFNPAAIWSCIKAGNLVDASRWAHLHDPNRDMPRIFWLESWASSREVHSGYYGYNLGHAVTTIITTTETDPSLYREYAKYVEPMRQTVSHHQNPWFDAVWGATIPSAAPTWGATVEAGLQRWALRDLREVHVDLRNDPGIVTVQYTSALLGTSNVNNALQGQQTTTVAAHPIPIEKRAYGAYIWQSTPFRLVGQGDPRRQNSGIELLLPYWTARSYGMIR